jgi:hypothetical protein
MSVLYRYYGFGLDFQSVIPIPEMREGAAGHSEPVIIQLGAAPCPGGLVEITAGVAAGPHDFWMDVPGIVRLHVSGGSAITIDPASDAILSDIRTYLLGSAMGALLHQRGLLPLHASAVEIEGQAVVFCGPSGAGKSSIALRLVKRGHRLLCDDICVIDTAAGAPRIWPGLTNLKLWRESLEAAGEEHHALDAVLPTLDKYKLPITEMAEYRSFDPSHIFLLSVSEHGDTKATPLHGVQGISALVTNTFRGQLVHPMGRSRGHFDQCIATSKAAHIILLSRPWALPEVDVSCAAAEFEVKRL